MRYLKNQAKEEYL